MTDQPVHVAQTFSCRQSQSRGQIFQKSPKAFITVVWSYGAARSTSSCHVITLPPPLLLPLRLKTLHDSRKTAEFLPEKLRPPRLINQALLASLRRPSSNVHRDGACKWRCADTSRHSGEAKASALHLPEATQTRV